MVNIIVAFPKIENGKSIKSILIKNGFHVNGLCTTGAKTLQYADMLEEGIVVCAGRLMDMACQQLREYLPDSFEMLVMSAPGSLEEEPMEHVLYLTMPLKVHELVSTMEMMAYAMERRKRKKKFRQPERSQEEKETLQKAKEVLMERNHMTEEEAHRYIQKSSMDSGTGLVEAAQMMLSLMQ